MWSLRQALHGRDVFTKSEMDRMAQATNTLRAVVLATIKTALDEQLDEPPFMAWQGGPVIGRQSLGGYRPINQSDVDTAAEHRALLGPSC
jgi:hypothetical protein